MTESRPFWVIGHKIQPLNASGNYDILIGETPSGVPGPPSHYHSKYAEFVLILKGQMEFIINGESRLLKEGESIDLAPHCIHTFNNPTSETTRWLNIHSPKGFYGFFKKFGISVDEEKAFESSVSESMIGNVVKEAETFDMMIVEQAN